MDYISNFFGSSNVPTPIITCNIAECNKTCIEQKFNSGNCITVPASDNSTFNVCSCIK